MFEQNQIVLYNAPDWWISIDARMEWENLWLSLQQISELYGKDKSWVSRHIKNIFTSWELSQESVVAKIATTAADGKTYDVDHYDLDMIISVWYRVNSKQATHFRKRATSTLKQHVMQWYTVNPKRLEQTGVEWLKQSLQMMQRALSTKQLSDDETKWMLDLIMSYLPGFLTINKFNQKTLEGLWITEKEQYKIERLDAVVALANLKAQLISKGEANESFAHPKSDWLLDDCFWSLYEEQEWNELYPSVEEKSAMLLYLVIKNQPFTDGNKRAWAYLFVWYLHKNNLLLDINWKEKISQQTLVALTLLIETSNDYEKEMMMWLVVALLR